MPRCLEVLERLEHLGERSGRTSSGSRRSTRQRPAPRAASFTRTPIGRPDAELLGVLDDQLELGELLDDRDDVLADLAGQHRPS